MSPVYCPKREKIQKPKKFVAFMRSRGVRGGNKVRVEQRERVQWRCRGMRDGDKVEIK